MALSLVPRKTPRVCRERQAVSDWVEFDRIWKRSEKLAAECVALREERDALRGALARIKERWDFATGVSCIHLDGVLDTRCDACDAMDDARDALDAALAKPKGET